MDKRTPVREDANAIAGGGNGTVDKLEMARALSIAEQMKNLQRPSKFVTTMFCARKSGFFVINAFFVLFVLSGLSFTLFGLDCKSEFASRLNGAFSILFSIIAYKFVINNFLPNISYLTAIDYYIVTTIMFIFCVSIWNTLAGRFWSPAHAGLLDYWAFVTLACAFAFYQIFYIGKFVVSHCSNVARMRSKERAYFLAKKLEVIEVN